MSAISYSNVTKKAFAAALKELMEEVPFEKISVADICGRCQMNRKSFYYHFKDKYDLVNWIFDIEFFSVSSQKSYKDEWEYLEELCNYFYDNKKFYRYALKIKGQNSFAEHFTELMIAVIMESVKGILTNGEHIEFYVNFCSDAFIGSIERWILDINCVQPKEFISLLKSCVDMISVMNKERDTDQEGAL